ncbi:MAG: hypothetical protein V2I33_24255 [Kangiellaceae bacterium]|nr:hypothetical protein [Kangiellaceae bacterium]
MNGNDVTVTISANSVSITDNTWESNGVHGKGALYIIEMANVNIDEKNKFLSNVDTEDVNSKVVAKYVANSVYLKADMDIGDAPGCSGMIYLINNVNLKVGGTASDWTEASGKLEIKNNACEKL